jgi:putative restriction endonuclease
MNWIEANRKKLGENNYVLKADVSSSYWFGLSENKVNDYVQRSNSVFNIILFGNELDQTNYYVIPYANIKDLLIAENLYLFNTRQRWVGDIRNHVLRVRNSNIGRNISEFFSVPFSLHESSIALSIEQKNDYAIENAKREVLIRQKQSIFRQNVLKNFDYRCCLTNTTEIDLLVASHIIPWAHQMDHRLNPGNGLCLSILYDKLFDKGYFTLDINGKVILTERLGELSSSVQKYLNDIKDATINDPKKSPIMKEAILHHATKIFNTF